MTDAAASSSPSNLEKSERQKRKGFGSFTPEARRRAASKGGLAADRKGTRHSFTPEEAREAGRIGGASVSQDRDHMAKIGRLGGRAAGAAKRAKKEASK